MSSPFAPSQAPPAGWLVFDGQLQPDRSVAGYLARGREVVGVCHVRDCRRRCEFDFARMAERGLGRLRIEQLKPLYRCHRLDGCALEFEERHGSEITLAALVGRDYVAVRIACEACRKATVVRAEAVIARLKAEGTGASDTSLDRLAGLIRGACPKCNAKRWRVDVLWHDPRQVPAWVDRALSKGR